MIKTLLAAALLVPATIASAQAAPVSGYHVAATIPVGGDGGWDYARVDGAAHRLYVARSSTVSVVDTAAARSLAPIGSIARGHAVVPVRGGRVLVTSGNDASVRFLDAASGRELGRVTVGAKPDAAILSDDGRTAYVMNAEDGTVSVVDVDGMRVERTITVKPALEYGAIVGSTLFVADEDANEMEVVDTVAGVTRPPIALPGLRGAERRRLRCRRCPTDRRVREREGGGHRYALEATYRSRGHRPRSRRGDPRRQARPRVHSMRQGRFA